MDEFDYDLVVGRAIPLGPSPITDQSARVPFSFRPPRQSVKGVLSLTEAIDREEETLP